MRSGSNTVRILVLCAGNIGRSPLAEVLLRYSLAESLEVPVEDLARAGVIVTSAGTDAPEGHGASQRGIEFAADCGIDLSGHRAAPLTAELLADADLIYGMDNSHLTGVKKLKDDALSKTALWEGEGSEIPDPHYEDDQFFRRVALRIELAVPLRTAEVLALVEERFG